MNEIEKDILLRLDRERRDGWRTKGILYRDIFDGLNTDVYDALRRLGRRGLLQERWSHIPDNPWISITEKGRIALEAL